MSNQYAGTGSGIAVLAMSHGDLVTRTRVAVRGPRDKVAIALAVMQHCVLNDLEPHELDVTVRWPDGTLTMRRAR